MTRDVSILTLGRGRADHLANVIHGLARQTVAPCEIVVAVMQDEDYDLPEIGVPVRQVRVAGDALPLARARNAAAAAATGEVLAFVDIDCIPAPTLVADYAAACAPGAGVMMGEVMYLPKGANAPGWDAASFERIAVRHSDRQGPPPDGLRACNDYRCFWSLNFAMNRADWYAGGGFDERFEGYGGEDTDFARTLSEREMPIWWMRGARVYHQHHAQCMPPIHQVPSILRNAEVFASKWGHRTMEHWIYAFRMMGLVEVDDRGIRILRAPGPEDFALCTQKDDMPYAATAPVVRFLQDRERRARGETPEAEDAPGRHAAMVEAQEALVARPGRVAAE